MVNYTVLARIVHVGIYRVIIKPLTYFTIGA